MSALPENSQKSFKEGVWFVFKDGENTIRLWLSNKNGKEQFYINDEIVSEKKALMKVKASHEGEFKGDVYRVDLRIEINGSNSKTVGTLLKNNEPIQRQEIGQKPGVKPVLPKVKWALIILLVIAGVLSALETVPKWIIIASAIPLITIIIVLFYIRVYRGTTFIDTTEFLE